MSTEESLECVIVEVVQPPDNMVCTDSSCRIDVVVDGSVVQEIPIPDSSKPLTVCNLNLCKSLYTFRVISDSSGLLGATTFNPSLSSKLFCMLSCPKV